MLPFAREDCTESTQTIKEKVDQFRLMPRVKMALRMYAYGAVPTLTAAAEAMDLNLGYLSLMHNSIPGKAFMESADKIIADKALEGHQLLDALGRRALEVTSQIMEDGVKEDNRLRAAIDLADRSPTYSKVQRHQVEAITLSGKDAKALAEALVMGPRIHEQYSQLATGDFNRIQDGISCSPSSTEDNLGNDNLARDISALGLESSEGSS